MAKNTQIFMVLVALIILCLSLMPFYGQALWRVIFGNADLGRVNISQIERSAKPHDALICPALYCRAQGDGEAPVFNKTPDQLHDALVALLEQDKMITIIENERHYIRAIVRSLWFQFPDTLNIDLIQVSDHQTTLALYSISQIGYSDMGVNLRRLKAIIHTLSNS